MKYRYVIAPIVVVYLLVPFAVLMMAGNPSSPGIAGTPTSVGSTLMVKRAEHTLSYIPSGTVCEIGVGRGVLADTAKRRGYTYWGIDCDPDTLTGIDPNWCQLVPPLPPLPYTPDAFVIESVIEHLPDHDTVVQLLGECHDALRNGGILFVRTPDIRYAKWNFWDAAPDHTYVTSMRRLSTLCREAGFEIVDHGYYLDHLTGVPAKAVYLASRLWPWRTLHGWLYEPWQESAFSKIAEKVPGLFIVGSKNVEIETAITVDRDPPDMSALEFSPDPPEPNKETPSYSWEGM